MGTSYLEVEVDGKKQRLVEGDKNIELSGVFSSSILHNRHGHGAGFTNKTDNTDWNIIFFFTEDELFANTGNFKKLFEARAYDFVRQDQTDYSFIQPTGVVIQYNKPINANSGNTISTVTYEDAQPQKFEVTNAYFYIPTYDRFIWVEGNFDCWQGNKATGNARHIKGSFRIKVQHDLQ